MARRGRKRKSGIRYKSGDVKPARGEDVNTLAARMPHRASAVIYSFPDGRIVSRHIPVSDLASEKAESPLGRFRLVGAITEDQYLAARILSRHHSLAKRAMGIRRQRESVAGFAEPSSGTPREMDEAECTRAIAEYIDAMNYLGSKKVQNLVINCIFYEYEILPEAFPALRRALWFLVKYYGLTT